MFPLYAQGADARAGEYGGGVYELVPGRPILPILSRRISIPVSAFNPITLLSRVHAADAASRFSNRTGSGIVQPAVETRLAGRLAACYLALSAGWTCGRDAVFRGVFDGAFVADVGLGDGAFAINAFVRAFVGDPWAVFEEHVYLWRHGFVFWLLFWLRGDERLA
ncbi:hypothetical protein B0O99DRAFT_178229 [Bisporella sp. PMI_857]|nr:hypothetical protein B0O99DRAFT_178229 [Bisporella sp. PMI_857]